LDGWMARGSSSAAANKCSHPPRFIGRPAAAADGGFPVEFGCFTFAAAALKFPACPCPARSHPITDERRPMIPRVRQKRKASAKRSPANGLQQMAETKEQMAIKQDSFPTNFALKKTAANMESQQKLIPRPRCHNLACVFRFPVGRRHLSKSGCRRRRRHRLIIGGAFFPASAVIRRLH
jgi:hypothetical protein